MFRPTYPSKKSWLFVYVFVTLLGKMTINVENHQKNNISFHTTSTTIIITSAIVVMFLL